MAFEIKRLRSGGIITNYHCSSACMHCVYASAPNRNDEYITVDMADRIAQFLKKKGCNSIHIGGGEPFLEPERLKSVLTLLHRSSIRVEYIETNASWAVDEKKTMSVVNALKKFDVGLLISIDPFHNAYVPLIKIKRLMHACEKTGIDMFLWRPEFLQEMEQMDERVTHTLLEYEQMFGPSYINDLLRRYPLNFRGRALTAFSDYVPYVKTQDILQKSMPCHSLLDTWHFHIDLHGNYIPQSCAGLSIDIDDMDRPTDALAYPITDVLVQKGVRGLLSLAQKMIDFVPQKSYISACDLCEHIRAAFVQHKEGLDNLQPEEFYRERLGKMEQSEDKKR